jgi:hypothetical protein
MASANPYQNYTQPQASDHDDDLIDPDTGEYFAMHFELESDQRSKAVGLDRGM